MSKIDKETRKFNKLKKCLFYLGPDYIEEFLGYEYSSDLSRKEIEAAMDEVYGQMPAEELEQFYEKFLFM